MNNNYFMKINQVLALTTVCAIVLISGSMWAANGPNLNTVPNLVSVRNLVSTGQAKFQVVDKQIFTEKTVIELVLVDAEGKSIGGYAPPYLSSQAEARNLWKDFVSANLSVPAMPDQMNFTEESKSENESFAVGFVLDHSPSMTMPRAIRMQKAVQNALKTFDPLDYASVVKFTSNVTNEV
ncbi:MAG: VWA domain-containing protein [Ignavibacteria bacterium]|nr:VWA domain-containing protein [Ignavibacteria bacterium]